jgi:hypothetical protein
VSISPDTKDWTWVLRRPCPECGFDATSFAREDIAQMIRDSIGRWQAILARADVLLRPSASMWSPLEYGCHVRDVYRISDRRIELMVDQHNPTFPNWDQDATAIEEQYSEQDPVVIAYEIDAAASLAADRLDAVQGAQWDRPGVRSNGSLFTVESYARYLIHDPLHHEYDVRMSSM